MPKTIKVQDWRSWWDGLRSKSMKAGAESLATNLSALLATNGIANMDIPGLTGIALGWKTAVCMTLIQFLLRIGVAAAQYVQNKPDPDIIEQTFDTAKISKNAKTGENTLVESKTVVTSTPLPTTAATPQPKE